MGKPASLWDFVRVTPKYTRAAFYPVGWWQEAVVDFPEVTGANASPDGHAETVPGIKAQTAVESEGQWASSDDPHPRPGSLSLNLTSHPNAARQLLPGCGDLHVQYEAQNVGLGLGLG